ncbi:MAG TPA: hypothetical protein VGF59_24215 [Bryobacteraceae bacterium]|jgi:hypothetical protein
MRVISTILAALLALPAAPPLSAQAQTPAPKLSIVVIEGEGAINNIRQRTARDPIVQVEDENHRPVAGAAVVFTLPSNGAGGAFANGAHTLTTVTDAQGRAVARGFRPNNIQGRYEIRVNASSGGQTASTVITQTNALIAGAGAAGAAAGGISAKLIAIIAIAGAAAAGGGIYAATHNSGGTTLTAPPATTISAGTGTVGPPR